MIWWLIKALFLAAFVALQLRLSHSDKKFLGLIPPAGFALGSVVLYFLYVNDVQFVGIALDNVVSFAALALILMAVYFVCLVKRNSGKDKIN